MTIVSHPTNDNYRDNFDETFGKKEDDTVVEQPEAQDQSEQETEKSE